MKIRVQSDVLSKITDNNLTNKIANEPDFRKTVVKNISNKNMNKNTKKELLRTFELNNLKKYIGENANKYKDYNPAQISNIAKGLKAGIDISFYDKIENSAADMTLKRLILVYNKQNPRNKFDLSLFNERNNDNKIQLLFEAHKFNVSNPNNTINLDELVNIFDLKEAKKKFKEHIGAKHVSNEPVVEVTVKSETKKKSPIVIEKNIEEMSFPELADLWNAKHPKAQINAAYIYAQSNKRIQEMLYVTSIYNLKFKDKKIPIKLFVDDTFEMAQKEEILNGLKYNLKNSDSTIPVEKYMHADIPADNMRIINKIMRLMAEYKVAANIDFIIENYTDRQSLNQKYEQLFMTKESK